MKEKIDHPYVPLNNFYIPLHVSPPPGGNNYNLSKTSNYFNLEQNEYEQIKVSSIQSRTRDDRLNELFDFTKKESLRK